ncbi:MAG: DUF6383 domain-containing protein [Tannerella sp.]|jgi:hypothetical protein|nr:DUF6383 domain-containing protein [Tannerella sp.]
MEKKENKIPCDQLGRQCTGIGQPGTEGPQAGKVGRWRLLLPENPVSCRKASLFEKKQAGERKKMEFIMAGIEQIRIFVAVKKMQGRSIPCEHEIEKTELIYSVLILNYLIMNKKIFTLFAVSLMLFTTVFAVNAQTPSRASWYGNPVKSVPVVKGDLENAPINAYHLVAVSPHKLLGAAAPNDTGKYVLALDENGYLTLENGWGLYTAGYEALRSALWCTSVSLEEDNGQRPGYHFINRAYATPLAVSDANDWIRSEPRVHAPKPDGTGADYSVQWNGCNGEILVGGEFENWAFGSWTYTKTVEDSVYLRIQVGPTANDDFLTLILDSVETSPTVYKPIVRLAKVKGDVFNLNNKFFTDTLLRFRLTSAAPRILTKDDINTRLWTRSEDDAANNPGVTLQFDPAPTRGEDVFGGRFVAENPDKAVPVNPTYSLTRSEFTAAERAAGGYVRLRLLDADKPDQYVRVLDGEKEENYYNRSNQLFPKIVASSYEAGRSDFRFVYYPSEDSVAVNVFAVDNREPGKGYAHDSLAYRDGTDPFFNWVIWGNLIVRLQDLNSKETVLTVRDIPNNLRIHFGVLGCNISDRRATIPSDLYIIRDSTGRVLRVPLWAGDLTPRWEKLEANEDPRYMPSCQWLVLQTNSRNPASKVHFINREFDYIVLSHIQLYDTLSFFNANYKEGQPCQGDVYLPVWRDGAWIATGDRYFERVEDVPGVHNFRSDKFLGYKYIDPDNALGFNGYSFRYLHNFTANLPFAQWRYLGVGESNRTKTDTALYAQADKTFFDLGLTDGLQSAAGGTEKYGIGWRPLGRSFYINLDTDDEAYRNLNSIVKLERAYYTLKINDYFRYTWNDNYVVLEEASNARYGYTSEEKANARALKKAKFYLRSTYQAEENADKPAKTEFYALLDRLEESDFHHLTRITGLSLTDTIRSNAPIIDGSHSVILNGTGQDNGTISTGYAVLKVAVDDANGYARGEVKTTTPRVSTFAVEQIKEPLYRRFNTLDEGSVATDDPDTLNFYIARSYSPITGSKDYLYEDQHSVFSYDVGGSGTSAYGNGIRFLGAIKKLSDMDNIGRDQIYPHSFAIYVDTAYVNRGTGWIKPQYLLAVGAKKDFGYNGCPTCGDGAEKVTYVYGRYLRNQADSAWLGGTTSGKLLNKAYTWKTNWNRLSFVNAIHAGDTLYILNEQTTVDPVTGEIHDPIEQYYSDYEPGANGGIQHAGDNPGRKLDFKKLYTNGVAAGKVENRYLGNNLHKDEVFSFRFVNRQINPDGTPIQNPNKEFYIESETTDHLLNSSAAPVIAPMEGGWVRIESYVPVISRGAYSDVIFQSEIFDVEKATQEPVANESVAAAGEVKVISGKGSVTILNAAGKQVLITNLLGQTVAAAALTSDQATLDAPQGIVVVTVDGNAVKAVVK